MKTYLPPVDSIEHQWKLIDLKGITLGRTASRVSRILQGKDKPVFAPHIDMGDHVIAINAAQVKVSGNNKHSNLRYYRYSGYPGGLKTTTLGRLMEKNPPEAFKQAVKRMLPKTKLGAKMLKRLHVYTDASHPHVAQKPKEIKIK